MGPYKEFGNVAGGKRDTQLDAETGRERSHERGRGSVRTAAVRHARPGVRYVPASPTDNELIDAAVTAEALMAAVNAGPRVEQEVSVDRLQQASPEKKQKTTKMPAFGQAPPGLLQERHHPPLFHEPPSLGSTEAALPKERPEVYNLEEEPPWVATLQANVKIMDAQRLMAQQMQASGAELASIQSGIRNLSIGQESLTRRADEQEAALDQMKREFKQLERELQEIKSAPPTRNVSPVQTPRSGYARSDSPRFSGQREVDELQIVIGGWAEAKRDLIEGDVRNMFEALRAGALLKAVYVPYVRSGFCRVELVYAEQDLWARRKLQTTVLKHLQGLSYKCGKWSVDGEQMWGLVKGQQDWDQDGLMMAAQAPGAGIDSTAMREGKKLFAKVLMIRLRKKAPPYGANQLACQPGVQVLDGITAAQATMAVVKRLAGTTAKVAKLDIKAAFDSVSHAAVFQWLMACDPCAEAVGLMNLCFGTSVQLGFGGVEKTLSMSRGIMQGSAYSADLFSRIMDWYLAPVAERFGDQFPEWEAKIRGLPHFLIYADDLIVFSDTEAGLQQKVHGDLHSMTNLELHDSRTPTEHLLEDFVASARSMAHLFDLLAYQDPQWHEMMQQLEDVFRAHTELNKAVNVLLGDVAQRMPKSTTAAAITAKIEQLDEKLDGMAAQIAKNLPEAWHSQTTKALNELMDQVESGMQNLNRQLAEESSSSAGRAAGMAPDMLVQTRDKSRETLARVELLDKNLEKLHSMVQGMAKVLEQPDAAKLFSDIAKPLLERIEQLTRAKMQSIGRMSTC
eukprot:s2061_g7.t1